MQCPPETNSAVCGIGDLTIGQEDTGQMTFEVVHADNGNAPTQGQGFGRGHPDQKGTDQSRPAR